jgi:hypothetical protein
MAMRKAVPDNDDRPDQRQPTRRDPGVASRSGGVSIAALTTISRDGYPQASVVSCDFDRGCVRANTMRCFAKGQNILRDPWVSLWCYDLGHLR